MSCTQTWWNFLHNIWRNEWALAFPFHFSFRIRDHAYSVYKERLNWPHILKENIFINDAQDLFALTYRFDTKSSAIILSVISPYSATW